MNSPATLRHVAKVFTLLTVTAFIAALPVRAQQELQAANGTTSIVDPEAGWALSFDAKDTSLGLAHATPLYSPDLGGLPLGAGGPLGGDPAGGGDPFGGSGFLGLMNNLKLRASTQKGKRDLLSSGDFNPAFEVSERVVGSWLLADGPLEYVRVFGELGGDVARQKTAAVDAAGAVTKDNPTGGTLNIAAGANLAIDAERFGILGFSGTWKRNWDKSTASTTREVCSVEATDGPVSISNCSDRLVGPTRTDNAGQFRFDWLSPRYSSSKRLLDEAGIELHQPQDTSAIDFEIAAIKKKIGALDTAIALLGNEIEGISSKLWAIDLLVEQASPGEKRDLLVAKKPSLEAKKAAKENARVVKKQEKTEQEAAKEKLQLRKAEAIRRKARYEIIKNSWLPDVGLLAAASVDVRDQLKPRWNFAIGPVLYRPLRPTAIIASLMLEFNDVWNGGGDASDFDDKFALRLYVGIPFGGLSL